MRVFILFIKKKNESLQLCIDYRDLDRYDWKNCYSLSLISETIDQLIEAKIYIKLNIWSVYNLIWIKKDNEWKTAFRSYYKHFEYFVMLFELINASMMFQEYINKILVDYLNNFYIIYIDDILTYSESEKEHIWYVNWVLKRLQKHHLYVKLSKCKFHINKVSFMRFILTFNRVLMKKSWISTVKD